MKNACLLVLVGFATGTLLARLPLATAVEPFKKEFESKYVKKDGTSDAEKSFAAAVEKAKCNVCHVGKSKKNRNEYGKALGTLLTKKDGKDSAKIQDAFEKVAVMKSDPKDDKSPTFGDLIKEGKLPGGEEPATGATTGN